ncbi:hypothetical protein RP20_CCG019204 [Aedes albopictus]|nr:hypothetical protein RP20_CCG019204 [Aedes albopictus]
MNDSSRPRIRPLANPYKSGRRYPGRPVAASSDRFFAHEINGYRNSRLCSRSEIH